MPKDWISISIEGAPDELHIDIDWQAARIAFENAPDFQDPLAILESLEAELTDLLPEFGFQTVDEFVQYATTNGFSNIFDYLSHLKGST